MTWQSQVLALLTASLLRPLILAAAAWLLLRVLKVRHPASRHAVWSAVLIGMLLLPVASLITPHWSLPLLPRRPDAALQTPHLTNAKRNHNSASSAISEAPSVTQAQIPSAHVFAWPTPGTTVLWCYLAGVLAMTGYRITGWIMLARIISRSRRIRLHKLRESSDVLTPVTVGVLRPSVILPVSWLVWSASTRHAVLAHEFAHLRRGDRWISFLTRLAKSVYWFHPLAWWVSRQIADLAELSCDAVVVEKSGDPAGYSRILLSFAQTVNRTGNRAAFPGLAIASRSGMGQRIDQAFELASGSLLRLSRPGWMLALIGLPVIFIAATLSVTAQPPSAARPKFDVVSVKRCSPNGLPGPASGEGGGRGTGPQYFPGRIRMQCMTVGAIMQAAYLGQFGEGDGLLNYMPSIGDENWLKKAPGWVSSELYTVEGKTDSPAAKSANGRGRGNGDRVLERMLQMAMEDRFHLKLHQETEDVPMFNLTVAKGGLKMRPMEPGGCNVPDPAQGTPAPSGIFMTGEWTPSGKTPPCMIVLHTAGPDWALDAGGQTPGSLVGMLAKTLDRHVFDKTGVTERYTFHLRFAHDGSTPGNLPPAMMERMFPRTDIPSGPSIFTALDRVGLKLEPTKGPQGHYVIDHIERPSEN